MELLSELLISTAPLNTIKTVHDLSQKKVTFRDTDINLKWSNFRVTDIYSTTL